MAPKKALPLVYDIWRAESYGYAKTVFMVWQVPSEDIRTIGESIAKAPSDYDDERAERAVKTYREWEALGATHSVITTCNPSVRVDFQHYYGPDSRGPVPPDAERSYTRERIELGHHSYFDMTRDFAVLERVKRRMFKVTNGRGWTGPDAFLEALTALRAIRVHRPPEHSWIWSHLVYAPGRIDTPSLSELFRNPALAKSA